MVADWIALDVDPMHCAADELTAATVRMTSVNGNIVHDNRQGVPT